MPVAAVVACTDPVRRVLVTTGAADEAGVGAHLAATIRSVAPDVEVRLVVGPWGSTTVPSGVVPVHAPAGLTDEMAAASIVVTAGGVALLESCALGRPTIAVPIADNQQQAVAPRRRRPLVRQATPAPGNTTMRRRPAAEWIGVAVPALVPDDLFERAQARLARNREWAPRNTRGAYLLRRLVSCGRCDLAHRIWTNGRSVFYSCPGTSGDTTRGQRGVCRASLIATWRLDAAVWADVCQLLVRRVGASWIPFAERRGTEQLDLWVNGLPGGESPRGQEHAVEAGAARRRLRPRPARPDAVRG